MQPALSLHVSRLSLNFLPGIKDVVVAYTQQVNVLTANFVLIDKIASTNSTFSMTEFLKSFRSILPPDLSREIPLALPTPSRPSAMNPAAHETMPLWATGSSVTEY